MKKRFLSILMALALALSLLPSAALASETTDGTGGGPETTVADEQTDTITGGEETTTTTGGEVTTTTEGGGETTTPGETEDSIPVETGDETDTSDGTETPVVTTPTVTPTETTPVETLTPEPTNVTDGVAVVNGTQYETLAAAIGAVEDSGTVMMLKTVSDQASILINNGKQITLDLNGQDITFKSGNYIDVNNGTLDVIGTGTIESSFNGSNLRPTIYATGSATDRPNYSVVTIGEDVTVDNEGGYGIAIMIPDTGEYCAYGAKVTIAGTLESTYGFSVTGNAKATSGHIPELTVTESGKVISDDGAAIYAAGYAKYDIAGTLSGNEFGIEIRAGELTIEETASITSSGPFSNPVPNGNGSTVTGAAVAVSQHTTNLPITVEILGGTISANGDNGHAFYEIDTVNGAEADIAKGVSISIEGGNFIGKVHSTNNKLTITGGTFSTEPSEAYIASGYEAKENTPSAGLWTVAAKDGMEANVTPPTTGETNSSATVTGSFSGQEEETPSEAGTGTVDADGGSVTINVQTAKDDNGSIANTQVTSTTVTLDKASVASLTAEKLLVYLETDVADLTLDPSVWDIISDKAAGQNVIISIAEQTGGKSWEVTAKTPSGTDVFADGQGSVIPITVSDYKAVEGTTNVQVYCTDNSVWEAVRTTWAPATDGGTTGTLRWYAPHFSSYATQEIGDKEASWTVNGGKPGEGSLEEALGEVASAGGTITLYKDAPLSNAQYVISGNVTINGNDNQVTVTVKAGDQIPEAENNDTRDGNIAFNVGSGATFTLNDVDMTITGTKNGNAAKENDGTGFNVSQDGVLKVNDSTITVQNIERATTAGGAEQAHFEFTNSTVEFRNIDGNASNGGNWTLDNTDLTINGCGSYGLSASNVTVKNGSTVDISNVGYSAIIIANKAGTEGALTVEDGSTITVSSSGSKLPQISNWSHAEGVIDLGHGSGDGTENSVTNQPAQLRVNDTSSIILNGNNQGANFIYLTNTAEMENSPTATLPTIQVEEGMAADTYTVRFMVDGKVYNLKRLEVNDESDTFGFPLKPVKAGWNFTGWTSPSGVTVKDQGNGSYTLTGAVSGNTYDFVAQWSYNVPVTPSDPGSNRPSSSVGSNSEPSYSPVQNVSDGGTIKVSPRTAEEGDEVTITPDPDAGYEVADVTVTRNGRAIEVTENRDGTWTFTQPSGRVTIDVTFQRIGGEPVGFTDVPASFWAADEINWAYENGYVNGTTATTFNPNGTISRQQVWMILARLSGSDPADMAAARTWAMENGVSDGTNPGGAVTRQQLVALLYRFAEDRGYANDSRADLSAYPDAGTVAEYAVEPMRWSVANDIVGGTTAGTLNPEGTATRAQFAVILYRFWSNV